MRSPLVPVQRGSLLPSLTHLTPHPTLNPTFSPILVTHRSLTFLSKGSVLEIPILSHVYFGFLFDFPPFFLQVSCWYQHGYQRASLCFFWKKKRKKRDEFRTYRVENNSHEKAAIVRSSAKTGLAHPSLPEATSLGGHPFGTDAASIPQGFESCALWVIKGWVIGYQRADSSFASALKASQPFFFSLFYKVFGIWFISSFSPLFGPQI